MVDIKTAFNLFSNYMTILFQKWFPQEIIQINLKNKNQALKDDIKERHKLYWINRKYPTSENKAIYRTLKNTNLNNQRRTEKNHRE